MRERPAFSGLAFSGCDNGAGAMVGEGGRWPDRVRARSREHSV